MADTRLKQVAGRQLCQSNGKSHEKVMEEHIPSWWGIIVVGSRGKKRWLLMRKVCRKPKNEAGTSN